MNFPRKMLRVLLFLWLLACPAWAQNVEDAPLDDPAIPTLPTSIPGQNLQHHHSDDEPIAPETSLDPNAFLYQALYAGLLVAGMCGYLGVFVVARRMVFIGVALAEMSAAGTALGLLIGFTPLLGALVTMFLGVVLLSKRFAPRVLPPDAPVGIFYLLAVAAGILMISKTASGESHLLTLTFGDVLAVYPGETLQMLGVFAVLALIHALFAKEFQLVSLDRDMASTLGYRAQNWDFLLFLTVGVAVALSIRSVGVLMCSAMLVFPAATALLLWPRWNRAALLAPVLAMFCVAVGLFLSYLWDFPASALITAVAATILAPVLIFRARVRA